MKSPAAAAEVQSGNTQASQDSETRRGKRRLSSLPFEPDSWHYSRAKELETFPFIVGYLGYAQAKGGHKEEAHLALQRLDELGRTRYISPACYAYIYLGLEENELAIAWLEKAYQVRSQWIGLLKMDPLFDPLRADRRFQALLKKAGLDH